MTGMPCGPNQEGSCKGYSGENNIRYGRHLGRVIAAHYEEIVVDQLFTGDVQLTTALQPLARRAEGGSTPSCYRPSHPAMSSL
jgi:hypothetical protein